MRINLPLFDNHKRKTETVEKKISLPGTDWGIQEHLITELRRLYPDQAPSIDMEMKDIFYRAGQVSVIRKLKQMQEE